MFDYLLTLLNFKSNHMVKSLQMDGAVARKLYPTAAPEFKTLLEENFGKTFFSQNVRDRINTFEDILAELGMAGRHFPYLTNKDDRSDQAVTKLRLIVRVCNQGRVLDWLNSNQPKYYPYFKKTSSGWSVVSFFDFVFACLPSGLYFDRSEDALWAANKFLDIYKDYLLE